MNGAPAARRFPLWITLAAAVVLVVLLRLGFWQLDRRREVADNAARIAALAGAPARDAAAVLSGAASADHVRVRVACGPPPHSAPAVLRYALPGGQVGWRLLAACPLDGGRYDSLALDRGLVAALAGSMAPVAGAFPPPRAVVGVLRRLGQKPLFGDAMAAAPGGPALIRVMDPAAVRRIAAAAGLSRPAPYYLAVESEAPPPPGVRPAPVTEDTPRDNFSYALTWFGLAGALVAVWGGLVWRRMAP